MTHVDGAVLRILAALVPNRQRRYRLEDTYYTRTRWLLP